MVNIGIHSGSGKMGKMIFECLKEGKFARASAVFTTESLDFDPKDVVVTKHFKELFDNCDVVIDFTIKDGATSLLKFAKDNPKPICMGTTGLDDEANSLLKLCSQKMPILYATNMSLGVAVLNSLVSAASKALSEFDIEIVEMHHRHKKDAPSGTAFTLATSAASARGLKLENVRVSGRDGLVGARSKNEIAVMSLRGGDIVGRHTVGFYNDGEFIELNHTATSRATFANGAIKAAVWVHDKEPGLYSINDCLGI